MAIKKATRERVRLRMALDGPSGSGKSYSSLIFGTAIIRSYGGKMGVIDAERGRALNYADYPLDDGTKIEFDHLELKKYGPLDYVEAIREFEKDGSYTVLVIDGISQAWAGEGGALEQKDKIGGNNFTAWGEITPMQNRFISALTGCQQHLICTMRSKTSYVMELNENNKNVPRRIGLEPIQRKNIEYEFNIYGSFDLDHRIRVTKSDCSVIDNLSVLKPGLGFMDPIIDWMRTGTSEIKIEAERIASRQSVEELLKLTQEKLKESQSVVEEKYYNKHKIEIWHAPEKSILEAIDTLKKTLKK